MDCPDTIASYESDTPSEERPPSQPENIKIHSKFQIARPPPKAPQRLRISPKLLLQVQQLPSNHRPVPVLEVWQPPLCRSKLTKGFPQRPKLGPKDIYATLNEPYIPSSVPQGQAPSQPQSTQLKGDSNNQEKDIIAAICQPSTNNPTSAIHFRNARCTWQASTVPAGDKNIYKFVIKSKENTGSEQSRMIMQWEKRTVSRRESAAGSHTEHFVLVAIDRKARRKSRVATMNPGGFDITVRKSSVLDHLRTCMALTEPVSGGSSDSNADLEIWLYTLVLTLGVSVASQEGWLG
ncbi:hypothetical protein N7457_009043 [Penicillium paradoxum]|uniref:uncharacterized protein n=1 Tax=Penicillium paradoxum TaxID=176176 RepID=UPI002548C4FD|nr:uncharacterized protein N7457_009043 [Penicillium paradoxum]KAJ5774147.1 hypothetical protein N7457_009043 [Penicillium paradoxum]